MLAPAYRKDDPKIDRYPSVYFTANMLATTDWRDFRYLEQPVYNPMDHSVTLGATLWDQDGPGWSQFNLPSLNTKHRADPNHSLMSESSCPYSVGSPTAGCFTSSLFMPDANLS
jgi:hypothetical protein